MTASLKVLAALSVLLVSVPAFAHGGGGMGHGGMDHGALNQVGMNHGSNNGTTNFNQNNKNSQNGNNSRNDHGNNARLVRHLENELKLIQLEAKALQALGVSPTSPKFTKLLEQALAIQIKLGNVHPVSL
jgi:hypothetical protein